MTEQTTTNGTVAKKGLLRRLVGPAAVLLAACGAVVGVAMLPKEDRPVPPTKVPPVNVTVETVRAQQNVPDVLEVNGTVEPNWVVNVAAEVSGRIERYADFLNASGKPAGRPLCKGDRIVAGQPLMYVNADLLTAERDRAQANYDFDRGEYERMQEARRRGVATDRDVEEVRARLAVDKATLEECRTRLDRTAIVAPVGGVLNDLPVEVGERAADGMTVAQIVDSDRVKVVVQVPEKDVHYFRPGAPQEVYDALGGRFKPRTGEISYISELGEKVARTTRVEIRVPNDDHGLRSEQIVTVRMKRRDLPRAVLIPLEAVIPTENGHMVFLEEGGLAVGRAVRIDVNFIRGTRILVEGLADGERLIVQGNRLCGPGQAVRVIRESAPDGRAEAR